MENKDTFNYTYSAKEQEEIKKILKKYEAPKKEENNLDKLRALDKKVSSKAASAAITVGTIGTLMLGLGMSFVMTELNKILGSYSKYGILLGIFIGLIGIALICTAYPIYNHTIIKERKKIAPEIIRLSDELLK